MPLLPFKFGEPVRARHDLVMIWKIRKLWVKHSRLISLKSAYISQSGRKASDHKSVFPHPGIIQNRCPGRGEKPKLFFGQHPFMISDGNKGRCDCCAAPNKRKNIFLAFQHVPGFLWSMTGDQVTGDRDQIRFILFHTSKRASTAYVVKVGDQGDFDFHFI